MAPLHSTDYLEAVINGLRDNVERQDRLLTKFSDNYEEDMKALVARMTSLEASITHDRATRAAWNQLIGFVGATLLAATTFFSGVFNHLFNSLPHK